MKKSLTEIKLCPTRTKICALSSLSERHGLSLTAFAAWRIDISHTGVSVGLGRNTNIGLGVEGRGQMHPFLFKSQNQHYRYIIT